MSSIEQLNEEGEKLLSLLRELETPKISKYIPISFTPKQKEVFDSDVHELLAEGSAGSGKSIALLASALKFVSHPKYNALILRREFPQLGQSGGIMDIANNWLTNTDARWSASEKTWRFPSGASLKFGHMMNVNDKLNYQGGSWDFIGFDELTQFTESQYLYLHSRNRHDEWVQIPLRIRATTNPGGTFNRWVKNRFITPTKKLASIKTVKMNLDDNPHLNKESYLVALNNLDEQTKLHLKDGIWTETDTGIIYGCPEDNILSTIPNLPDPVYVLAVDLGASQIKPTTAFVLLGYSRQIKDLVVVLESKAYAGLSVSDIAEIIKAYQLQYDINNIVMDQGALGAGYITEMNDRWYIPAVGVQKANKLGYRKLLSTAIKDNIIRIYEPENKELIEELRNLPWNEKGQDAQQGYPDHLSDALLYAYRECLEFLSRAPNPAPPKKGEPGWGKYEEQRMWDKAVEADEWEKVKWFKRRR